MDVAILYSGGKDSTYAIEYCQNKGWNIKYLMSIKPNRTDCYLYHFATVELTKELSKILGYKQFYLTCDIANPKKEALIVKDLINDKQKTDKIDALVLGGVGLQETQLRSLQKALMPLKIEVFASYSGYDEGELFNEMIEKGYKIVVTQVASDGLMNWLGRTITKENFKDLKKDSIKYCFNLLFEGGYADTLVVDGPIFNKRLEIINQEKIIESRYNGYIKVKDYKILNKEMKIIN